MFLVIYCTKSSWKLTQYRDLLWF